GRRLADGGEPGRRAGADRLRCVVGSRGAGARGAATGPVPRPAHRLRVPVGVRGTRPIRPALRISSQNGGVMAEDLQNFIGGQWTDMSFDKRSELINPSTGEVFATAPVSGETEVDAAVSSAAAAFEEWRGSTPAERSLALLRVADAIEARARAVVKAGALDTRKPPRLTKHQGSPP